MHDDTRVLYLGQFSQTLSLAVNDIFSKLQRIGGDCAYPIRTNASCCAVDEFPSNNNDRDSNTIYLQKCPHVLSEDNNRCSVCSSNAHLLKKCVRAVLGVEVNASAPLGQKHTSTSKATSTKLNIQNCNLCPTTMLIVVVDSFTPFGCWAHNLVLEYVHSMSRAQTALRGGAATGSAVSIDCVSVLLKPPLPQGYQGMEVYSGLLTTVHALEFSQALLFRGYEKAVDSSNCDARPAANTAQLTDVSRNILHRVACDVLALMCAHDGAILSDTLRYHLWPLDIVRQHSCTPSLQTHSSVSPIHHATTSPTSSTMTRAGKCIDIRTSLQHVLALLQRSTSTRKQNTSSARNSTRTIGLAGERYRAQLESYSPLRSVAANVRNLHMHHYYNLPANNATGYPNGSGWSSSSSSSSSKSSIGIVGANYAEFGIALHKYVNNYSIEMTHTTRPDGAASRKAPDGVATGTTSSSKSGMGYELKLHFLPVAGGSDFNTISSSSSSSSRVGDAAAISSALHWATTTTTTTTVPAVNTKSKPQLNTHANVSPASGWHTVTWPLGKPQQRANSTTAVNENNETGQTEPANAVSTSTSTTTGISSNSKHGSSKSHFVEIGCIVFQSPYARQDCIILCDTAEQLLQAGAYAHLFTNDGCFCAEELYDAIDYVRDSI